MVSKIKIFLFAFMWFFLDIAQATSIQPPNPGGDPGNSGGTVVGAPIDNGLWLLLGMGFAYSVWKYFVAMQKQRVD